MTAAHQAKAGMDILLVDADAAFRDRAQDVFAKHNDAVDTAGETGVGHSRGRLNLTAAATLHDAVSTLKKDGYQLVIANYKLADGSGMELLPASGPGHFPVLVISDEAGEQRAVEAIKAGAIDYRVKSADSLEQLPALVIAALQEWEMMLEHQRMQLEMVKMPQREQQRLGQELHDGVGQQLTGLGMVARSLSKRLSAAAREREMAEQLASGLEQALADVRHLSRGLFPVQMDAHGLASALEELAARVAKQSGIKISLRYETPMLISNNDTATHVYRIIQEAINNAVKHAQAREITLTLEADEETAVIEVRDDGRGLPDDVHERRGMGLHTMFHRCQLFGGSLDIYTHDEGGTRVRCCFSLHPEKQAP